MRITRIQAACLTTFAFALAGHGCGGSSGGHGGGSSQLGSTAATSSTSAASTATGAISRPEYIVLEIEEPMTATDIVSLLDRTVGAATVTSGTPASSLVLRPGVYATATPRGANTILRFESDGGGKRPREAYVEVAVSAQLGRTFVDLVDAATATAALTAATPGLGQPWNLFLQAQSVTGGTLLVNVAGDATGSFTLNWKLTSPVRAIDAFAAATAFGPPGAEGATEKVGGTVHFPIDEPTFKQYVNRAYGYNAPQRFTDFPLVPHAWLHLTVTADATGRVVNVHFDAIANSGARIYVAEAPASSDVGGRFFDETVARMEEMAAAEAALPGSSKKWGTSFYYSDALKGVVDVVVSGVKGQTDIAYAVETPMNQVKP